MKNYEKKDNSFYTFAKTCIERKILTLVTNHRRLKHKILNESLSLDMTYEDQNYGINYFLKDMTTDPETVLLSKERETQLEEKVHQVLTDFEEATVFLTNPVSLSESVDHSTSLQMFVPDSEKTLKFEGIYSPLYSVKLSKESSDTAFEERLFLLCS